MRNLSLRRFLLGTATALAAAPLCAQECVYPTTPNAIVVRQPDGREVSLHFRGKPPQTWYEDELGLPVLSTGAGYVYALESASGALEPTPWPVGSVDPRRVGITAHVARPAPAPVSAKSKAPSAGPRGTFALGSGSVKNLVVLLRFSNHGPSGQNRTLPSTSDVDTIMNAVGGDPTLAPSGSVRDHYLENSYNQFTIDSVATGWLNLPNSEGYYTNNNSGLTTLTWELITDGLDLADATVDFSEYDQDGDGWVDAITFLHSGYGAEWGGADQYGTDYTDRMWSHKWEIPAWTSAEGIKVADYNISPGLWGTSGSAPGRIGVVCHELGHFFGLPDLYDTDGSSEGAGNWCLMAGGAWGFGGSQQYPSHMSAWAKIFLGWVTPTTILPGAQSLPQVELNPTVLRIDSGYPPGEHLLIENRQATGFDLMIPQSGIAVWHIDSGKGSLGANSPNNDEGYPGQSGWPGNANHYRNALLQADGDYNMEHGDNRGDSGDVYRSGGVTTLDNATTPNTNAYQNGTAVTNNNRLQSISATGATMTFTYANSAAPTITTTTAPDGVEGTPYSLALASSGGTNPKTWMEYRDDPQYDLVDLGTAAFTNGGTAQNWTDDENVWTLTLPFAFPYYERSYTKVYVSSNGFIDLALTEAEPYNRWDWLRGNLRIAALWDDLTTNEPGGNIFVDNTVTGRTRIRWAAEEFNSGAPCNFAISLFSDGRILFEYGNGNTSLSPTVGISRSYGGDFIVPPSHDGQATLTNASRLQFTLTGSQLPPGLSLSSAGVISGTPTQVGTFTPRFRVTDNALRYHHRQLTIEVSPDCNGNSVADAVDISSATSDDCDQNAVPDECDPDLNFNGIPDACESNVTAYCFGDGSTGSCPCGDLVPNSGGCPSSLGAGAVLSAVSGGPNELVLHCSQVLPNQLCVLLQSSSSVVPGVIVGDGLGCLGATPPLSQKQMASVSGTARFSVHGNAPGQVLYYQVSYRDAANFCTPATTNRTNALEVHW
jgi:M6 family metalloprotease-like protein